MYGAKYVQFPLNCLLVVSLSTHVVCFIVHIYEAFKAENAYQKCLHTSKHCGVTGPVQYTYIFMLACLQGVSISSSGLQ